jgi:DNA-binding MarR family transcriptional regulator
MKNIDNKDTILRTFLLLMQTAHVLQKYTDAHLYKKASLSTVKFTVIQVLASNNGVMKPSELAEWTQTERHNITALLNRMKGDGLVTTERSSNDKRIINVTLTDKGRSVLGRSMIVAKDVVNQIMRSISEDDAVLLEKILVVLRQNAYHGLESLNTRTKS